MKSGGHAHFGPGKDPLRAVYMGPLNFTDSAHRLDKLFLALS